MIDEPDPRRVWQRSDFRHETDEASSGERVDRDAGLQPRLDPLDAGLGNLGVDLNQRTEVMDPEEELPLADECALLDKGRLSGPGGPVGVHDHPIDRSGDLAGLNLPLELGLLFLLELPAMPLGQLVGKGFSTPLRSSLMVLSLV